MNVEIIADTATCDPGMHDGKVHVHCKIFLIEDVLNSLSPDDIAMYLIDIGYHVTDKSGESII